MNNGHGLIYIPKSQKQYAMNLAKRKYLSGKLADLNDQKKALQYFLSPHPAILSSAAQILSDSRYHELLSPTFQLSEQDLADWSELPYESNPNYTDQLTHHTISGHIVRSKSEAIIDMALFVNQIPFRYEAPLILNDIPLYPDFTLLHPRTKQIYYWEHFGMIDDPSYAQKTFSKLSLYASNNIIPSIQLITTFETKDHPLNSELIEEIIEHYFL